MTKYFEANDMYIYDGVNEKTSQWLQKKRIFNISLFYVPNGFAYYEARNIR